jgi:CheY-like chemotaxis protein
MVAGREHRVLVVDDNTDVAHAIARGLEHLGYTVRVAHDGLSGLEVAVEFRPHAAVLDLSMPILDGWELAQRFRTLPLFKQPRLIALTGLCSPEYRAKSTASGFHHHVVKPASLATLDRLLSI